MVQKNRLFFCWRNSFLDLRLLILLASMAACGSAFADQWVRFSYSGHQLFGFHFDMDSLKKIENVFTVNTVENTRDKDSPVKSIEHVIQFKCSPDTQRFISITMYSEPFAKGKKLESIPVSDTVVFQNVEKRYLPLSDLFCKRSR